MLVITAPGPNSTQNVAHAHEVIPDPRGKFVVVLSLCAADLRWVFETPKNSPPHDKPISVIEVKVPKGSGPRHGTFVVTEERFTYFYILTQISNELIGFKVSGLRKGWDKV